MVGGQRALGKALGCKDHQADVVVGSTGNEGRSDRFGGFHAVGLQVFSQHTAGNIQGEHDVDALGRHILPAIGGLRPG